MQGGKQIHICLGHSIDYNRIYCDKKYTTFSYEDFVRIGTKEEMKDAMEKIPESIKKKLDEEVG